MPVIECDVTKARSRLEAAGLTIRDGNTEHERWRVNHEGATAVAYDDKVVVQGGQPEALLAHIRDASGRAHVYFDGASRGNPGPASIGWVIVTNDGIVAEGGEQIGTATNNQAEYEALNMALERAAAYGYDVVDVRGDSELIVKQIRGEYGVNDPALRELRVSARETLSTFDDWSIQHVPREVNSRADELANEAFEDE
jgi:ribonuclease HI